MPGRSTIMPVISFNSVDSAVSSLKTCHVSINTGIEVTTDVALALTEHEGAVEEISNMEKLMLDYVSMDRELEQFIQAVGDVTHQVLASPKARVLCSAAVKSAWDDCHLQIKQERPERMPDLKALVDKRFNELNNLNKDEDLIKNDKYICFKGQLKEMKKQVGAESQNESTSANEIDEDIAVTQSQRNFICPITQREMECPVKNKVCGHSYEEEAIIKIIQNKHKQKKKARCPVVGCDNGDMNQCDLSADTTLRRAIENHKKHQTR
ncbi:E3 SUMO-protein ligase NSE2 isoform X1 [Heterodontus francisci]|uniref:E3 SUMO-protein ligase NSE2 isoform X1 n=1 Tax=Heterodontus francisci TaxID=7792 RepID=UPI00355C8EC3